MAVDAVGAGLCGAFGYGCADFAGGRAASVLRTPITAAIAQGAALAVTLAWASLQPIVLPGAEAATLAILAGIAYAAGLMLLYRGFAEGSIGLVAPSSGLVAALVPVAADIALTGQPSDIRTLGLVMAGLSVVLLGASTHDRARTRFSLLMGAGSGLGYGIADLCLALTPAPEMAGALCLIRLVATLVAVALIVPWRRGPAPVPRRLSRAGWDALILAIAAGLLDALGHQGFALAASTGQIALAAALTALHPLVAVALGVVLLRDRISRVQWLGSLAGITSMALLVA
jgi:uncharacterized membrane protein